MTAYHTSMVYANAHFKGPKGNIQIEPRATLPDGVIMITREGDRILALEWGGVTYRPNNPHGANLHGGLHTNDEWFTFGVTQFRDADGNRLVDQPGWRGITNITPRIGVDACFGPDVRIYVMGRGYVKASDVIAGDWVRTDEEWQKVLWSGGRDVKVTAKNATVLYRGEIYSPHHRLMHRGAWITARQLVKAGLAELAEHAGTQHYCHILLDGHHGIVTEHNIAESLLPTDRALSAMAIDMASEIRHAMQGRVYELNRPVIKAKDLEGMT